MLASVKEKIKLLKDVPAWSAYFFTDDFAFDEEAVTKTLRAPGASERLEQLAARLETLPAEAWTHDDLEAAFKALAAEASVKTAALHPPGARGHQRPVGRDRVCITCSRCWARKRSWPGCKARRAVPEPVPSEEENAARAVYTLADLRDLADGDRRT